MNIQLQSGVLTIDLRKWRASAIYTYERVNRHPDTYGVWVHFQGAEKAFIASRGQDTERLVQVLDLILGGSTSVQWDKDGNLYSWGTMPEHPPEYIASITREAVEMCARLEDIPVTASHTWISESLHRGYDICG